MDSESITNNANNLRMKLPPMHHREAIKNIQNLHNDP